jgi:AraC-like DNA-binding protein
MRETPNPPDLLDAFLDDLRLKAAFVVLGHMGPGTHVDLPAERMPALHHVRGGRCSVAVDGTVHELRDGDLLFMPTGLPRRVGVGEAWQATDLQRQTPDIRPGRIHTFSVGRVEGRIEVLGLAACPSAIDQALTLLPRVCVQPASDAFHDHLDALLRQLRTDEPGATAMATRLAEVVFVRAMRDIAATRPEGTALALAARDPHLARALLAVQADLAASWTVPALAKAAGLSRSGFAELFRETLGCPPMRFIRRWRMDEATRRLRDGAQVQEVADALGYASAAAFSSAYKAVVGRPPSAARTHHPFRS